MRYLVNQQTGELIESPSAPIASADEQDKFLKGDGSYSEIDASPFEGTDGAHDGKAGTIPKPLASDVNKFLSANGGWVSILNIICPIGSIRIVTANTNPSTIWPGTEWELLSDGYLKNNASAATGGSTSTGSTELTVDQIPAHTHTATTGLNGAHTHTATTGSYGAHTHTLSTGSAGAHTHTATTGSYGAHTHTATTGSYGAHTHTISYKLYSNNGSSNGTRYITGGSSTVAYTITSSNGAHTHTLTTGSYGAHTHTLTTGSYGSHTHTATTDSYGAHTHTLTTNETGAHTHTLETASVGNSEGHSHTIEPTYARVYAFRRIA